LPPPPSFSHGFSEQDVLQAINNLRACQAVTECAPVTGQFLSPFFLVPKPDGSKRFVLNLKALNTFMATDHFQLEDGRTVLGLLSPGDFFGKLDFDQAYYSVAIHPASRKFLRFTFQGQLFEFTCLPFGLCTGPWLFTKLLKPAVQSLQRQGLRSVIYLDDFLCLGESAAQCAANIRSSWNLFQSLGFQINTDKSVLLPTTTITFLGLIYNSVELTISLPQDKRAEALARVSFFLQASSCRIRDWARFVGLLNFCCHAIPYGRVYLKELERIRFLELSRVRQDYDAMMLIPRSVDPDLRWWLHHLPTAVSPIRRLSFHREIFTDASNNGWGAFWEGTSVGGPWSSAELEHHINHKELLAAFYGLRAFASLLTGCAVLLRIDNTTAVAYINKMGGVQFPQLNKITKRIWQFCEERRLWLSASYIPSTDNVDADRASRIPNLDTEWELAQPAFHRICSRFGRPEVDLFATRENAKCARFFSWFPEPGASGVDAFTQHWGTVGFFYAFPPFALILRSLRKIIEDKATGILVVPVWATQPWFPLFHKLRITECLTFSPTPDLLLSVDRSASHRLRHSLRLQAAVLSGKCTTAPDSVHQQ